MKPRPFNIITKPIGPRCNIDCTYCYYLEKERLFPDVKKFRMSDEVLEAYIRQLIETSLEAGMPRSMPKKSDIHQMLLSSPIPATIAAVCWEGSSSHKLAPIK